MAVTMDKYLYKAREIEALQLNKDNQPAIIELLAADLANKLIAELSCDVAFTADNPDRLYTIKLRYRSSTTTLVLEPGDYFAVDCLTGEKLTMKEVVFYDAYEAAGDTPLTPPRIDYAILSE